jgi:hypothetical protein
VSKSWTKCEKAKSEISNLKSENKKMAKGKVIKAKQYKSVSTNTLPEPEQNILSNSFMMTFPESNSVIENLATSSSPAITIRKAMDKRTLQPRLRT